MTGLRERKKERTRHEIIEVALKLFEKKGYDGTTIEEIAEVAEVSARTVFRYFTSKEDLVFLGQDEENARVAELMRNAPKGTPALDALMAGTRAVLTTANTQPSQLLRSQKLIQTTPTLRAHKAKVLQTVQHLIADGLTPPRASKKELLRIRMMAAVYMAALDAAMSHWIEEGAKGSPLEGVAMVEEVLRRAFGPS